MGGTHSAQKAIPDTTKENTELDRIRKTDQTDKLHTALRNTEVDLSGVVNNTPPYMSIMNV